MSIESKHAYRFQFLKSDKWKAVRLEALVREKGQCQICGEESVHNDAHHAWYPKNIWDTVEKQIVVLCRPCHTFVHAIIPECKTCDDELGIAQWIKFRNAIEVWRVQKLVLFEGITPISGKASELRRAYVALKEKYRLLRAGIVVDAPPGPIDQQLKQVTALIRGWAEIAREYSESVKTDVADPGNPV